MASMLIYASPYAEHYLYSLYQMAQRLDYALKYIDRIQCGQAILSEETVRKYRRLRKVLRG
jgi:hypothetical protein